MAVAVASLPTPAPTPPPTKQQELKKRKQPQPPYLPNRHDYHPTHPSLFRIEFGPEGEEFGSCLRAERAFAKGEILCPIRSTLPGTKAYSSVQVLPDPALPSSSRAATSRPTSFTTAAPASTRRHIELNSDLLYVNHSCDPNVVFDVNGREAEPSEQDERATSDGRWRVRAEKDIAKGEILTFAYFSTEWDMDQPFHCLCGTKRCLGTIQGARHIEQGVLDGYFVNDHILAMKALQREEQEQQHQ
ncbi:hypothetical protein Rhopal_003237-T1 [Rhodotorula paludigena]|uniref:SET domain-containing protein n=1 Tax=Rhodotorula paludigena TaxID=86838 RepID=A0AAV5GJ50_9BASI|nr:hypothetical protein Rhopal_003237-T1 [Rhodotorula paludigena]